MKKSKFLSINYYVRLPILLVFLALANTMNAQDTDNDNIIDVIENGFASPDVDTILNFQDADSDDDGISDATEYGVDVSSVDFTTDGDSDGIPDAMDASSGGTDTNGNGIIDSFEPIDTDGDSVPDFLDLDSDNDGIYDVVEAGFGAFDSNNDGRISSNATTDMNNNGQVDATEGATLPNTVGTTSPNYINTDSDDDGCPDALEAAGIYAPGSLAPNGSFGTMANSDGVPDAAPNGQQTTAAVTDDTDNATCAAFIDSDNDGITDGVDLDDDNDGILDFEECGFNSTILGPFTSGNTSFDFTGTGGVGPATLNSITHASITYSDFVVPDAYEENFATTSQFHVYEVNNNVDGNTGGTAGNNISNPTWNSLILPAFQSSDFNYFQKQDGGIVVDDYYTLQYNTPIVITGDSFILISERGGNNNTTIEAYDVNGTFLGSQIVLMAGSANYLSTGITASNSQEIEIAVYALTDLGAVGQEIASIRMISASSGDGPDGKVFIVANNPVCADTDGDGIPNKFDLDSDNDGITDVIESGGTDADMDGRADDDDDNANNAGSNGVPSSAGTGTVPPNSDANANDLPDYLDIDADDDGIPDNIEGQSTAGYIAPSGVGMGMTDANMNGLDDNYENGGLVGIDPENTDGTDQPDYLDLNSDNDGFDDIEENGDTDNVISGVDTDGDGLDDAFDDNDDSGITGATVNDGINPPDASNLGDIDSDLGSGGDVDYRDALSVDSDGDGVLDDQEAIDGTDANDPCDFEIASITETQGGDWLIADCDGDGVTNQQEVTDGTNPEDPCDFVEASITLALSGDYLISDCDGDGVSNGTEITDGTDPLDPCDYSSSSVTLTPSNAFLSADCDGDGVTNGDEINTGSDPLDPCDPTQMPLYTGFDASNSIWSSADCDGDQITNGQEVTDGTDPYDPCSSIGGTPPAGANCDIEIESDLVNPGLNNGIFQINNIEVFPDNNVKIFNRWGVLVFETEGYNNSSRAFRGISNGRATVKVNEELPVGVYFYIINYVKEGNNRTKSGYLYVNR